MSGSGERRTLEWRDKRVYRATVVACDWLVPIHAAARGAAVRE